MRRNSSVSRVQLAGMIDCLSVLFLVGSLTMDQRVSANDGKLPSETLIDVPVNIGHIGEAYSGTINPLVAGVYWFEIRYPHSREEVDAKTPRPPRKLGQPHHKAFGGKLRVDVFEASSGRNIMTNDPQWSPMEISTSGGTRVCGDRMDFRLREGVAYKVRLSVEEATPALHSLDPRFIIEASDSVRDHKRGAWGSVVIGVLAIVGVVILAVMRKTNTKKANLFT